MRGGHARRRAEGVIFAGNGKGLLTDPLELTATTPRVRAAARAAKLSDPALDRALDIAVATPSPGEWRQFLSRALALLGAGLLLAGVVCFIAYNWARFGRFGKFALVEAAIVGAAVLAGFKLPRVTGQVALLAAAVLVGPLLAIYGQTYQTGADPYGLFLTWAWLIVPWVIAARFAPLWLIEIGLLDVALALYWFQVIGTRSAAALLVLPLVIAALHFAAVAAWEWQFRRQSPWLNERWAPRTVLVFGYFSLWVAASAWVLLDKEAGMPGIVGVVALAGAIAGAFLYYRRVYPDRFLVTVATSAGLAWVTVVVGRVIFDFLDLEILGLFLMAGFVVLEITLGLKWYRGSVGPAPAAGT